MNRAHNCQGQPLGVLVVDDAPFVLAVVAAALRHEGCSVWTASGGKEGLELYQRHRPHIDGVLLDLYMPGLDGRATLERLRQIDPAVRCWFLTGALSGPEEEGDLLRCGVVGVIEKPFHLARLVERLMQELPGEPAHAGA
jgi:CheY-like chemotaxis protein